TRSHFSPPDTGSPRRARGSSWSRGVSETTHRFTSDDEWNRHYRGGTRPVGAPLMAARTDLHGKIVHRHSKSCGCVVRAPRHISFGCRNRSCVGDHWTPVPVFGYLATAHQHRHDHSDV